MRMHQLYLMFTCKQKKSLQCFSERWKYMRSCKACPTLLLVAVCLVWQSSFPADIVKSRSYEATVQNVLCNANANAMPSSISHAVHCNDSKTQVNSRNWTSVCRRTCIIICVVWFCKLVLFIITHNQLLFCYWNGVLFYTICFVCMWEMPGTVCVRGEWDIVWGHYESDYVLAVCGCLRGDDWCFLTFRMATVTMPTE